MHSVSLVIVTHNSERWLPALARSLSAGSERIEKIVIADAGSADETVDSALHFFPNAFLLEVGNIGFGAAVNRALEQIDSSWFLLCNPDLVFGPAFFGDFFSAAETQFAANPQIACFAPALLNADGSPQPSIGRFPSIRSILRDQLRPRPLRKYCLPQPTQPGPIDWATGACLLLRHEALLQIAGFDEKYFLYQEEVDLQFRLRAAGFHAYFLPLNRAAAVSHLAPHAAGPPHLETRHYAARGMLRYFAKFGTPVQFLACRTLLLLSRRLSWSEAMESRRQILAAPTGP